MDGTDMINDLTPINTPIFLHFLNRELREAEGVEYTDEEICKFIAVAVLSTSGYVYAGDAIIWESAYLFPKAITMLRKLEEIGEACFVGTDLDLNSFLEKRRRLYRHDVKRYPIYFSDDITKLPWATDHKIIKNDTTAILAQNLFSIANGFEVKDQLPFCDADKEIIANKLEARRKERIAITYTLFRDAGMVGKLNIKRQILIGFNNRYLEITGGKILTKIPGIEFYDQYESLEWYTDFRIHWYILESLGLLSERDFSDENHIHRLIDSIVDLKNENNKIFLQILNEIKAICSGISVMKENGEKYQNFLRSLRISEKKHKKSEIAPFLYDKAQKMCETSGFFLGGYRRMDNFKRKILVLSASPLEYKILREVAKERGYLFEDKDGENEDFAYGECVTVNNVKVYIARTDMGSLNAAIATQELNRVIQPGYIIVGGICAGMKPKSQEMGDIIISTKIQDFNLAKQTKERRISRGIVLEANRYLFDKFLIESYDGKYSIDDGLVVSADILSNHREYIKDVLDECPDAKAYEMEGSGVIKVCQVFREKWIMAKAICDWGYNKGNKDQQTAAMNSYSFIFDVISNRIGG